MKRKLMVVGVGTLRVTPEVARLRLGVRVTAATAAEASRQAADAMAAIMAAVRGQGIADRDIQTGYFAITQEYQHTPEGVALRIGHSATNSAMVTIMALDRIGALIDAALTAGGDAVVIDSLTFALNDPGSAQMQARSLALADALRQAAQIAQDMDITLGKPLRIQTTGAGQPMRPMAMAMMRAPMQHPIEAGELDVVEQVAVEFSFK